MRHPQRRLGGAIPPKALAKLLWCRADSQVSRGEDGGQWNLVTSRKMAPALVVEAQHTSGICHIQDIGGVVGEHRRHQLRISALCLRSLCVLNSALEA